MYVISLGNMFDGISLYGPFEDSEDALKYAEKEFSSGEQEWHLVTLIDPNCRTENP